MDFDEGNANTAQGPFLNWHSREKLDGSMPSRSFSVRSESGSTDVTAQIKKGVAFDLTTLKTGWCFSNGTIGVSPEWVWNQTPAKFDVAQPPDVGGVKWKKGFSVRVALTKTEAVTWSQAGAGAWAGLVSLMRGVKADGGKGETVIAAMSGVEEIKFAKGTTSAPTFDIKKWSSRPECLVAQVAEEREDIADEF